MPKRSVSSARRGGRAAANCSRALRLEQSEPRPGLSLPGSTLAWPSGHHDAISPRLLGADGFR